MANGRCRLHGGLSTGRPLIHGKYSKYIPKSLATAYEQAISDERLLSLRDEIGLFDALIVSKLEQIGSHGSPAELFEAAKKHFDELTAAIANEDPAQVQFSLQQLGQVLQNGLGDEKRETEVVTLIEKKSKLQEAEHRRLKMLQDYIDSRQAMALISLLLHSIGNHVKDPAALRDINRDFAAATRNLGGDRTAEAS